MVVLERPERAAWVSFPAVSGGVGELEADNVGVVVTGIDLVFDIRRDLIEPLSVGRDDPDVFWISPRYAGCHASEELESAAIKWNDTATLRMDSADSLVMMAPQIGGAAPSALGRRGRRRWCLRSGGSRTRR